MATVGVTSPWTARRYERQLYGDSVDSHRASNGRREDFNELRDRGLPLGECALRLGVTERTVYRYEKRRKAAHAT